MIIQANEHTGFPISGSHPFVDPAAMGFHEGWAAEPFWNLPTKP